MSRARRLLPLRRVRSVTIYFVAHLAAAVLFALPAFALVAGTGIGRFPEGDRLLFQPGGLLLAEVARTVASALWSSIASARVSGALLFALLLVPHAALLVSLSESEREPENVVWGRAIGHLPVLLLLSGLSFFAQAVVLFAAVTVATTIRDAMTSSTARNADLAYLAVLSVGVLLALALGLVRDLGRAAAVRDSLRAKAALRVGLMTFARAPGRTLLGWAAPAAVGLALVLLGAAVTGLFDVSRPGAWRVWFVALAHQAIAYALCWCRAFWLNATLGLVRTDTSVASAGER
jgi:hypothetical protein